MQELVPNSLLRLEIPAHETRNIGFLEIVNRAEKENTLSDVYRHFLDPSESPDTCDHFLGALIDICESKISSQTIDGSPIRFDRYEVWREHSTTDGRVDLVIKEKETSGWALIIEAKINHGLDNDLKDYWDRFSDYEDRRVGIVLGKELYRQEKINHHGFISVTHVEWMHEVISKLPESLDEKRRLYLLDLYETVKNFSMKTELNNQAKFYFDHQEQVNLAIQTKRSAEEYIKGQIKLVGEDLRLNCKSVSSSIWEFRDPKIHATLYYRIDIDGVLDKSRKLEVTLIAYDCARDLDSELRKAAEIHKKGRITIKTDGSEHQRNIAQLEIELSNDQIKSHCADAIASAMKSEFEPLRKELAQFLKDKGKYQHGNY